MAGVTRIQVKAALYFDDGHVIELATPVWHKDIRTGDYFNDELTREVVTQAGVGLAAIIEEKTLRGLYGMIKEQEYKQSDRRKPKWGDNFSLN
jgi:hypothetical protein